MIGKPLGLIGVPSSAGGRRTGQDGGPAALREAGLLDRLRSAGLDVTDLGDLPREVFRPDPEHPRAQNLALVTSVAARVADRVDRTVAGGRQPLLLGGDCSLGVGAIAGMLRHHRRLGLVYFDADVDLNTPETTSSGIFDGMVLAHILGRGAPELAGIGPRRPLLEEQDVVLFGYDVDSGAIDPPEAAAVERSRMARFPLGRVRSDPAAAAREAAGQLARRCDAFVVHFDVDVTDLPAVDVPHPGGLAFDAAVAALGVLCAAPACAAVAVTEFNAELDPSGAHARVVAAGLARALAGGEPRPGR